MTQLMNNSYHETIFPIQINFNSFESSKNHTINFFLPVFIINCIAFSLWFWPFFPHDRYLPTVYTNIYRVRFVCFFLPFRIFRKLYETCVLKRLIARSVATFSGWFFMTKTVVFSHCPRIIPNLENWISQAYKFWETLGTAFRMLLDDDESSCLSSSHSGFYLVFWSKKLASMTSYSEKLVSRYIRILRFHCIFLVRFFQMNSSSDDRMIRNSSHVGRFWREFVVVFAYKNEL